MCSSIPRPWSRVHVPGQSGETRITIYSTARLLTSNDLTDKPNLPMSGMLNIPVAVFLFRLNNAPGCLLERVTGRGGSSLMTAFGAPKYNNAGLGYSYPDHVNAEESSNC